MLPEEGQEEVAAAEAGVKRQQLWGAGAGAATTGGADGLGGAPNAES
jgi:hypothetical protein